MECTTNQVEKYLPYLIKLLPKGEFSIHDIINDCSELKDAEKQTLHECNEVVSQLLIDLEYVERIDFYKHKTLEFVPVSD